MYSEAENQETAVKNSIDDFGCLMNAFGFESDIQYLTKIGSIEGHNVLASDVKTTKYENMIPQLIAVQENPKIRGLLMVLNTVGGDVEAGLALAELISSISKPTVSLVLGGGHSIGIPLAVSADYSFIAPSAAMTLHPVRTTGLVIGAEQTYGYFRRMQERITDFIVKMSGARREVIDDLMNAKNDMANDIGTIFYGQEAVEAGLIDSVGGLCDALKKLRELTAQNVKL